MNKAARWRLGNGGRETGVNGRWKKVGAKRDGWGMRSNPHTASERDGSLQRAGGCALLGEGTRTPSASPPIHLANASNCVLPTLF